MLDRLEGNTFYTSFGKFCSTLLPGNDAFQPLGTVFFQLEPFAVFPPIQWIPEGDVTGIPYRATIVDDQYRDHHPTLNSGFEFARGNANNADAAVDMADPTYTLMYLFPRQDRPPTFLDCLDAADTNNDGKIDIADPIYTLSFMFANGPAIPAPYPQCGFDTDIDALDCETAICP